MSPGVANALAQARAFGYLGPGPLQVHVDQAMAFGRTLLAARGGAPREETDPTALVELTTDLLVVDLGSGGGIPGLVLADLWPSSSWVFVDSHQRRMATLAQVLADLGWESRCEIQVGRAEDTARIHSLRGSADAVVARGFAAPAVTAECAAGFLAVGGVLIVSEPPTGPDRWSDRGLARLGMKRSPVAAEPYRFFAACQKSLCPSTFPRAVGIPAKSPLF